MASFYFGRHAEVDYSIVDGRVRAFTLDGKILYDEDTGVDEPGWKDRLRALVLSYELDVDRGLGLYAFVPPLLDGLLILQEENHEKLSNSNSNHSHGANSGTRRSRQRPH